MRLLWFPRIQTDVDKMHITTWREMYKSLRGLDVDVKLAVVGHDEEGVLGGIPYIRIYVIKKRFLRMLSFWVDGYLKFARHYLSFKPDVVVLDVFSFWFSFPFALLPAGRRASFILDNRTPHFDLYGQTGMKNRAMSLYVRFCYWYHRRFLDGLTVITKHYKRQVVEVFGLPADRVDVWGSGVDTKTFNAAAETADRPPEFRDKFILMQHGTFTYDRGLFETVEALAYMDSEDVHLVLIGDSVPGTEIRRELQELARETGVGHRFHILPPVAHAEIPRHIGYCDCAVMAYPNIEYWNNNNPIKLLEYLAMGKLVVCTDMPCFRDVINDSQCARYLANNEPKEIAAAVTAVYENRSLLEQWGAQGADIVANGYTWEMQAHRLLDFSRRLRGESQRTGHP